MLVMRSSYVIGEDDEKFWLGHLVDVSAMHAPNELEAYALLFAFHIVMALYPSLPLPHDRRHLWSETTEQWVSIG